MAQVGLSPEVLGRVVAMAALAMMSSLTQLYRKDDVARLVGGYGLYPVGA
jgi:hypothetical protein